VATTQLQAQDVNSLLSEWNVITSGNLQLVNQIQGQSYVGGNVTVPNSFTAAGVGSSLIPNSSVSLAVAGNITSGGNIQVNGGSVVVGGSIDRTVTVNSHGTVTQGNPAALPASPVSEVTSASQYWSGLAANSSTTVANNQQLDFNCKAGVSLAVFNINANQFSSGYQGFTLIPVNGVTHDVLINVAGGSVNWTSGSFFSQFNTAQWDGHVLFNFYQATSVNLSGQIGGYVLAPLANVTEGNSIIGGVAAKNLTVDSAVDLPGTSSDSAWFGALPNVPVPEASNFMAGVGALVMFAVSFTRKKK
jgi:choice-of-anchor A domain-containing protein